MNRLCFSRLAVLLAAMLLNGCDKAAPPASPTNASGQVAAPPTTPSAPPNQNNCSIFIRSAESNQLWRGVKNRLSIAAPVGSLVKTSFSNDTVHVCPQEIEIIPSDTQAVKIEIIQNGQSLSTEVFKVRQVPNPIPYVISENYTGSIALTRGELSSINALGLTSIHPECPFTLVEFTSVTNVNGVFVELKSAGKMASGDMKKALSSASAGSYVSLHNIVAQGCDGSLRRLPPILIKVR